MHYSAYTRTAWFFAVYESYLQAISEDGIPRILDVGGANYNGSYDALLGNKYKKDVLDIVGKDNVTFVPSDPYKWDEIADNSYDLVMASETFQHIDFFWLTILEMKRVCKPGGYCIS